ncbi:hypothetical protein I6M90_01050 [Acinetobacter bereziniae]|uniref:hypothetical protein n=1 Tax=Acinetobacter bereziniae TaxID=106648 RepID=UPI0018FF4F22|nr:hypothetical protein [Acinetobacter bereziniae]MBJ8450305.1 hypothetical protein [Acinetobacter bereziniae]MBJ8454660.1 hypothetical protein [Acinetobacter bereziniae]
MNAVEFVKKHGWEAVIEAVKSTTAEETAAFESKDLDPILAKDGSVIGFNVKVYAIPYVEVKSLVESWELVGSYGSIKQAKKAIIDGNNHCMFIDLEQAIADVESVGGGV